MPSRKRRRRHESAANPGPGDEDRVCWLCLEPHVRATRSGARELVRCGCACRGSGAGWAHVPCIVRFAQDNTDRWTDCPTCKHHYSGPLLGKLARIRVRLAKAACARLDAEIDDIGVRVATPPEDEFEAEEEMSAAMNMLGLILIMDAQYTDARRILEQLVARDTERWGANDEQTLCSKASLMQALVDVGDFAVVRPMCEQLVKTCVEQCGPKSETTLDAQTILAQILAYVGEEIEARRLWDEIVASRIAEGGPAHHETIVAKHMYAEMLHKNGDAEAAQALYEQVLAHYTQEVGAAHEDTLNTEGAIAEIQVALGVDLQAAEQTLTRYVLC